MKLTNKTLILACLICASTACYEFFIIGNSLLLTSIIASLTSVTSYLIIFGLYLLPIGKLYQNVTKLNENFTLNKRITVDKKKNELNAIAEQVNALLQHIQESQFKLDRNNDEETLALKNENAQLQQELSAKFRTDKINNEVDVLNKITQYDALTSLPNGIFFNEILNKAINHAGRRKQTLAILLIELHIDKNITNTIGVDNVNLVLKETAKRFSNVLRTEDILAKIDDDEFIILLNDINKPKFAGTVAEKLISICGQLIKVESHQFTISANIGIAVFPNDCDSMEGLHEKADRALFMAKQKGIGNYQFYTEEIHTEAIEYIQLESALRKAIHDNELTLYYQPKFRIKSGNICGLEGLMRWEHPVLGIISPAKFIPLAEDCGLIMQVGEWALREACQKIKFWQTEGYEHVSVALKLSRKQFNHPDIAKVISHILSTYKVNPKYIELEITEHTIMENAESALEILNCLKEIGVQISIDHFGTGYTSISYLKTFPISAIKIDQSYIKGIPNNPDDAAITTAVIGLAHHLGLEVVAEGVETADQIQFLSTQQCDVVQGYFLGHPVTAQKILPQLKKLREEVLF